MENARAQLYRLPQAEFDQYQCYTQEKGGMKRRTIIHETRTKDFQPMEVQEYRVSRMLDAIKKDKATFDAQQGGGPQGRCVGGQAGLFRPILQCPALSKALPYSALLHTQSSLHPTLQRPAVPQRSHHSALLGGRWTHLGRNNCSHLRFDIKRNC